jgi:acyl-coenzyme A synthetase/AMP-(fatty) acid ligase
VTIQTGWMMFNYLLAALSCGARLVLYDGSPLTPSCAKQVDIVREQGCDTLSTFVICTLLKTEHLGSRFGERAPSF